MAACCTARSGFIRGINMTININESIRKMMGWCPNASALVAKRVMIALPEGEDFFTDEKGKGGMNMSKMGWGNKFRNVVLLMALISIILFGFFISIAPDFFEYLLKLSFKKGYLIIISFIIAVIQSAHEWRRYNHINEGKYRGWNPSRKKILVGIMIGILFLGVMRQVYFLRIDLPFDLLLVVMMATGFIYSIINYPMVIYWEWKNKKTIYLVEKESRGWRPVALPDRVS